MLGICYLLWGCVAEYMGAVLWSVMLYAVLCAMQPMEPLQTLLITLKGPIK